MARRIIDAEIPTSIWARRPVSVEPYAETGASIASTPRELGARSDVVGICVVDDDDVRSVVLGEDGVLAGMAAGSVLAIHSTVRPSTVIELVAPAAERGVSVIDAPVSGGGPRATIGELLVMVGGDRAALARATPVFETFASSIIHLGGLGSGLVAKSINNTLMTATLGLDAQAVELGMALGLDRAALVEVLGKGSAANFSLTVYAHLPTGLAEFSAGALLRKDVDIMESLASDAGTSTGALGASAEEALRAMGSGKPA
jgi:3-hydroxyisobutyrate dehydrogenase-like beta-hydroxyacid dehydrogenase